MYHEPKVADQIAASFASRQTVSLADYEMLDERTVRVILSTSGAFDRESLQAKTAELFKGLATPVRNSFRRLTDNSVVGFVVGVRTVRDYDAAVDGTKYRAIASNILMDKGDSSTWELREGASGDYLCRTGIEDLSELAQTIYVRRVGVPALASVAVAAVQPKEFAAFVDVEAGEMDYGFVTASDGDTLSVVSSTSRKVCTVPTACVVQAAHMADDEQPVVAGIEAAALNDAQTMIDYYTKAYGYAPEYLAKVIEIINQHAAA